MTSKKVNIKKLKQLALEIASKQAQENGIKINLMPMTIVEYYKSDTFKKDLILTDEQGYKSLDLSVLKHPFIYEAIYEVDRKNIIVFIKNKVAMKTNSGLAYVDFIIAIYHEIKHQLQYKDREKIKKLDFETFVFDIEILVQHFNPKHYNAYHGQNFMEIEANLYGVNSAMKYLKETKQLNELNKSRLDQLNQAYQLDLKNYDFQKFFRMFNEVITTNNDIGIDELPGWSKIFYDNDKKLKNMNEILNHEDIGYVDNRFLEAFFSSSHFLESIKFEELESKQQIIILNSIKNTYHNEVIREKSINKAYESEFISKKQYIRLINDVNYNIMYYKMTMYKYLNAMDKNNENITHFFDEQEFLEKTI